MTSDGLFSLDPPHLGGQDRVVNECQAAGEPFFVLRASDFFAVLTLSHYIRAVESFGPRDLELHSDLYLELNRLREWQTDNPQKVMFPNVLDLRSRDADRSSRRDDEQPDPRNG